MRVGAPVFTWTWPWGGCSKIITRSEVMSVANDDRRSHWRKSTSAFGLGRVLISREGSGYPVFEIPRPMFHTRGECLVLFWNEGNKRARGQSCLPRSFFL